MSVRLHAARTYKVEWGAGTFGSESENINSLLYNLCENICYNGPAAEYAEDLEIDANDFKEAIERGEDYDEVITIGPLIMMKFVVATTKPYGVKTTVSMNPILIDGTGMCGGCRLTVGGETKFACVDGPDFDGFLVDFDEAMSRNAMYADFERHQRDAHCNLLKKGDE